VPVLDAKGKTWLDPILKPLERLTYWLMGVDPEKEQDWKLYTFAMLLFSLVSCLLTYAILRLQKYLPLNPQGFDNAQPRPVLQYRRQLHHQYQLAKLHRRIDHVLSLPNAGAGHS
jgi:K+-transporting ATPase A subunit